MNRTVPMIMLFCGMLFAAAASADYTDMGHCTDDTTIQAENIISSCTGFISRALQQNWQLEEVPVALVYQAIAYERLEKYEKAEGVLKIAITKYPEFIPGWKKLGELLEKLKGPGMLLATEDVMVRTNPKNASVLNEACWTRATRGEQLDTAIADCTAALELEPGFVDALDSRAFAYFRKGDFGQAIKDTTSALAANPKLSTSLYVRGRAKLKTGDAAGGDLDISAAKAIDSKITDTYAGYGVTP